jgi:diadenosine tetraphosphate (Ap4A) HIT family hydrolase
MSSDTLPECRFCLANHLLVDTPLGGNSAFYMLASIDPELPAAVMIIPRRHQTTPFEMLAEEWQEMPEMLALAKSHLERFGPDGFTIGWNVGAVGGQHVFHTHLHIIARFANEPNAGQGIRFPHRRSATALAD